jgi:glucose-1-phosphate thymidylyltransferase
MKGLILAGGIGSRLWPNTKATNKHLLPVYDKPLIHYPLATLMLAGIREIAIVSSPIHLPGFKSLFAESSRLGLNLVFIEQPVPAGLPQGISLAKKFLGDDSFAMILGDNIFHGVGMGKSLIDLEHSAGAKIFCYNVANPENFGVAHVSNNKIVKLAEKPKNSTSNLAITGLYVFDDLAVSLADTLKPSPRGELEITDLLGCYLAQDSLDFEILPRGTAWLDTGTSKSLLDAGNYVRIIEERQGSKVAYLEEISWRNSWISDTELESIASKCISPDYADYLVKLLHA